MADELVGVAGAAAGVAGAAAGIGTAIADASPTHRQCTVQLTNKSTKFSLCNPRTYFSSGSCTVPLSPFIGSHQSDTFVFIKTAHTACGSVGVFTYDLQQNDGKKLMEKVAVMFSVPYDFNLYSNWYAVGIFDMDQRCDYDLYCKMYYEKEESFIRRKASDPSFIYEGKKVTIRAAMSDAYQPVMKLQVIDTPQ